MNLSIVIIIILLIFIGLSVAGIVIFKKYKIYKDIESKYITIPITNVRCSDSKITEQFYPSNGGSSRVYVATCSYSATYVVNNKEYKYVESDSLYTYKNSPEKDSVRKKVGDMVSFFYEVANPNNASKLKPIKIEYNNTKYALFVTSIVILCISFVILMFAFANFNKKNNDSFN